jgi:hypothetical protein
LDFRVRILEFKKLTDEFKVIDIQALAGGDKPPPLQTKFSAPNVAAGFIPARARK